MLHIIEILAEYQRLDQLTGTVVELVDGRVRPVPALVATEDKTERPTAL